MHFTRLFHIKKKTLLCPLLYQGNPRGMTCQASAYVIHYLHLALGKNMFSNYSKHVLLFALGLYRRIHRTAIALFLD